MIEFIIGAMVGGSVGVVAAGLLRMAKECDHLPADRAFGTLIEGGGKTSTVLRELEGNVAYQPIRIMSDDGHEYHVSPPVAPIVTSVRTGRHWMMRPSRLLDLARSEGIDDVANDNAPAGDRKGAA